MNTGVLFQFIWLSPVMMKNLMIICWISSTTKSQELASCLVHRHYYLLTKHLVTPHHLLADF